MKQVRTLISGKVIGIFFRAFVKEKANELGLTGWVRNTEDQKVEAVFQGSPENINKIIKSCHQGPSSSKVREVKIFEENPKEKFDSFKILY